MIKHLKQYYRDIKAIFRQHSFSKLKLFLIYNRLCIKNVLMTKIFRIKTHQEKVLGYKIEYDNFNSFFAMFSEIFLHEIYAFDKKVKNPVIVDCGANIGLATIYFKYKFPDAKVLCFEPDKETFQLLKKNIEDNQLKDIELHNVALSDKKEQLKFFSFNDFKGGPGNTIDPQFVNFNNVKEYIIPAEPLSSFKLDKIDILKIDVEGAERRIIQDLSKNNMLDKVDIIHLEYHYNFDTKENRLSEILAHLENSRFHFLINPDTLIEDKVELREYLKIKRYVLIITCFK